MGLLLIASLYKNRKSGIIGYRLLDTTAKETLDVPVQSLINTLMSGQAVVDNVKVESNRLIGTNGALERYPKCTPDNNLIDNNLSPIIIINRIGEVGFTVADFKGNIKMVKSEDVIAYAEKAGIANGKLVPSDTGIFVSAISGNYETLPYEPNNNAKEKSNTTAVTKDENKPENKTEIKSENTINNIFNEEQKTAIAKYYQYYFNREYRLTGNSDKAKEESKVELDKMTKIATEGLLLESYVPYSKFIYLAMLIDSEEDLAGLTSEPFVEHFKSFLNLFIPLPDSMCRIFNTFIEGNTSGFIKKALPGYKEVYERVEAEEEVFASSMGMIMREYPGRCEALDILSAGLKERANIHKAYDILYREAKKFDIKNDTFIDVLYKNKCNLDPDQLSAMFKVVDKLVGFEYKAKSLEDTIEFILASNPYLNGQKTSEFGAVIKQVIEKALKEQYPEESQPENSSLEQKFNDVFAQNHSGNGDESVENPDDNPPWDNTEDTIDTVDNNITEPNTVSEYTTQPKDFDDLQWLKWLLEHNPDVAPDDTSMIIAKDILKRNVPITRISSKQDYRIKQALAILVEANNNRLGVASSNTDTSSPNKDKNSKSKSKGTIPDTENITYLLSDKPEIKEKVERIVEKADSVEMQAVLKETPKVINICYSILRNGKASTRQLRHIDLAIEILDKQ